MKRIAAVVYNSVSHDSRVLKEADSLAAVGYKVRIIGIKDNYCMEGRSERDANVEIVRVSWRSLVFKRAAGFAAGAVVALLLAYLWIFDVVYEAIGARYTSKLAGFVALLFIGAYCIGRLLRVARAYGVREDMAAVPSGRSKLLREIVYVAKRATHTMAMKQSVLDALEEFQPDVIHCHDLPPVAAGHAYARRSGCKLVYDSHEIYEALGHSGMVSRRFFEYVQRYFSRKVDAFVTINDSIAEFLQNKYPALPPAVVVKNAGLPVDGVEYDGRLHDAAGFGRERRILLYQGGFADNRGLDALVRAAPLLPTEWCVVMMGWGAFEGQLRDIVNTVDPQAKHIRFLPRVPQRELIDWTAGATLGIIPYKNVSLNHWYCTPNKLWEYPSAGVPVLVSPFPEMRAVVQTFGVGWLLDAEPTAEGIARVIEGLGQKDIDDARTACARFVAHDNWLVYQERLVRLYEGLFASPSKSAPAELSSTT